MIVSEPLARWFSDPERQDRASARSLAVARRWQSHPLMVRLKTDLAAEPCHSAQALLAHAERFMDGVDEIADFVVSMVEESAADPFFRPPLISVRSDINSALVLFHDPELTITIGTMGVDDLAAKKTAKRGSTSIGFTGFMTAFHFIKSGGATFSMWEADPPGPGFVGELCPPCRFVGHRRIADGERLILDGRSQSFVVEHASSDILYLHASIRAEAAPLLVEYDSRTLKFVAASSTDEAGSRVEMMVSLLRMLDAEDAAPLIAEFLGSPHFHTRWHVMRELLALDAEAALPHLRAMAARDPHPEVRAAAGRTLQLFFPNETKALAEEPSCRA